MTTDDRIRVLHLLPPTLGVMRTHVLTLLEHMDRSRFDVTLAAPEDMHETIAQERLHGARFEALELGEVAEPLGLIYSSIHLSGLVRRLKTHILHAHGVRAMLASGLGGRTAPVRVATLHHPLDADMNPAARPMVAYAFRTHTQCVAPSQVLREELQALGLPRERITVIPHGVSAHRPRRDEASHALDSAGIPGGEPLVVIPARYAVNGGPDLSDLVTRVFAATRCNVAFTGEASHIPAFRRFQKSCKNDRVFFCGFVQDLRQILSASAAVALPAPGKATPLTALEAMACAKTVITSGGGELAEVIVDGVTGRIAPSADGPAFAEVVRQVLLDPAVGERMGTAAREHVLQAYSADVMIRKLEALYVELLETAFGRTEGAAV